MNILITITLSTLGLITFWTFLSLLMEYSFYGDDLRKLKNMAGDRTFAEFGKAWYAYYYPHTRFKTGTTSRADVLSVYTKWLVYKLIDKDYKPKVYFAPDKDQEFEVKKF